MSACCDTAHYFADPNTAAAVCMAESDDDPNANNGADFGLYEIEASAHPDFDMSRWRDPDYNAQYAAQLQRSEGWGPWTTFKTGAYKQYLNRCGAGGPGASPSPRTLLLLLGGVILLPIGIELLEDLAS